jgi:hypothetical protein
MAACLAGGGAFAIGCGLVRRGRAHRAAASICLAIVLPVAAFAAVAALTWPTAPPDKRFTDPPFPTPSAIRVTGARNRGASGCPAT